MWRNLDTWKSALQDGVLEFSKEALSEMRTTVTQSSMAVLEGALEVAKDIQEDVQAAAVLAKEGTKIPAKLRDAVKKQADAQMQGPHSTDYQGSLEPSSSSLLNLDRFADNQSVDSKTTYTGVMSPKRLSNSEGVIEPLMKSGGSWSARSSNGHAPVSPDASRSSSLTAADLLSQKAFRGSIYSPVATLGNGILSVNGHQPESLKAQAPSSGSPQETTLAPKDSIDPKASTRTLGTRNKEPNPSDEGVAKTTDKHATQSSTAAPNTPQPAEAPTPINTKSRTPPSTSSSPVAELSAPETTIQSMQAAAAAALAKIVPNGAKLPRNRSYGNTSQDTSQDTPPPGMRTPAGGRTSGSLTPVAAEPVIVPAAPVRDLEDATSKPTGEEQVNSSAVSSSLGTVSPIANAAGASPTAQSRSGSSTGRLGGLATALGAVTGAASGASSPAAQSRASSVTSIQEPARTADSCQAPTPAPNMEPNSERPFHGTSSPAAQLTDAVGKSIALHKSLLEAKAANDEPVTATVPAAAPPKSDVTDVPPAPVDASSVSVSSDTFQDAEKLRVEVQQLKDELQRAAQDRAALLKEVTQYRSEVVAIATETAKHKTGFGDMTVAYEQAKALLAASMGQCERLSDDVEHLQAQVREAQASAAKSAAAADSARREATEANVALATSRAEAAHRDKELAKMHAALEAAKQQPKAMDVGSELEELRLQLSAAVQKMAAALDAQDAAEARSAEAEAARAQAEEARAEAERLRRAAQAESHAALAAAEAERSRSAEAQGISATLKEDNERRARVFNNAVRAAVWKVQRDLDTEREELEGRIREQHRTLQATQAELRETALAAEDARAEAAARTRDAEAAGIIAVNAEQAADRARAGELEARRAAHAAELARAEAAGKLEHEAAGRRAAEAESATLRAELEAAQRTNAELQKAMEQQAGELQLIAQRQTTRAEDLAGALRASEAKLEAANTAARTAAERTGLELVVAQRRVEELQTEVKQMRASSSVMSLFALPTTDDVIAGLGLEKWRDERLGKGKGAEHDIESGSGGPPPRPAPPERSGGAAGKLASGTAGKLSAGVRKVAGHVSPRVFLLVLYLVVLHMAVMVSFTHRTGVDVAALCASANMPGTIRLP